MKSGRTLHLSDFIQVGARFLRSVNLEKDYAAGQRNGDYILTPTARQVLTRFADGLQDASPYRAWTITGPYGVGKSAFAVFLTRLLCPNGESTVAARRQLQNVDPALAASLLGAEVFSKAKKGLLPVPITARRAATSLCLLQGLYAAAKRSEDRWMKVAAKSLNQLIRQAVRGVPIDSARVVEALDDVTSAARDAGHAGVLLLIDELGKLFEYAARAPSGADVFVLQQLAEYASRSADKPVMLLGLLHQSFEDYGQHLDSVSRREWAKIQGRFEDVAFLEPPDQVIRMIASAIKWEAAPPDAAFRKRLAALASLAAECRIIPPGMKREEFVSAAVAAYPLHPSTLVALPFVFRRFAQNERSLFSYLSSLEPFGFQAFLQQRAFDPDRPTFIRLADLFDYFTQNFGAGLFRQPQAKRWLEAADVLDRKSNLEAHQIDLVKTIGVLNAIGEFSPLAARGEVVAYSLADAVEPAGEVANGVQFLKDESILTYRTFNQTYRIWEGSDVDLEERIAEGARKTRDVLSLAAMLERYLEPRPLVARKHSFKTGALRFFSLVYADRVEDLKAQVDSKLRGTGKIVVCVSGSAAQAEKFVEMATELQERQNLLLAIPQDLGELRAAASELAALRWVWDNTAELRDDRAARRELALRIADAERLLRSTLHRLLDPRPAPLGSQCVWYYAGKLAPVAAPADVSRLLSEVCDKLFCASPRVRNELIVRRTLSSAAAAARRNLVEAMLKHPGEPALGIQGFPPERSMYESTLRATEIHVPAGSGGWRFTAPPEKHDTRLWPAWTELGKEIFRPQPDPRPLDEVFRLLAAPPIGLMDGLHPVLLCAFMQVNADEVTLYREGTFLHEPSVADFELLMSRPELFAIAGSRVQGARAEVVNRLASKLGVRPATVPVVRAIFNMVRSLPEFARRTNAVPQAARDLRAAFDRAKSPERFLFVDLPQAINQPRFDEHQTDPRQIEAFFTCLNENLQALKLALPRALAGARDHLLRACGFPEGAEHWQQLRETAFRLEPVTTHADLLALLRRLTQSQNDEAGIASVLALVANCSPTGWSDYEVQRFPELARALGAMLRDARATLDRAAAPFRGLTPPQRRQAERLQRDIRALLVEPARAQDPAAARAALLALAEEFNDPNHAH